MPNPDPVYADRLTFEMNGPRITAQRFKAGFDAFLTVVTEVANDVVGKNNAVDWIISVEPGSVVVHVVPEPVHLDPEQAQVAIQAIQDGLRVLETERDVWPEHFTENALNSAKRMAETVSKSDGGLSYIKVGHNGDSKPISAHAAASVEGLLKGQYADYGSLEGYIRVLDGRGKVKFRIEDDLTGRTVNYFIPKEMWEEVRDSFNPYTPRRVSVSGMILYRQDGQPVNVTVDDFRAFRLKEELPTVDDMIGILK